uniref:afadin- and alpha-actinin-binding protein n=1 Tax=Myxine glutinosa TaxID=7769 RepID=UPI00358FC2EA
MADWKSVTSPAEAPDGHNVFSRYLSVLRLSPNNSFNTLTFSLPAARSTIRDQDSLTCLTPIKSSPSETEFNFLPLLDQEAEVVAGAPRPACLHDVFSLYDLMKRRCEKLRQENESTAKELKQMSAANTRLQDEFEKEKQEVFGLKEREQKLHSEVQTLKEEIDKKKDDEVKIQQALKQARVKFFHEQKRAEHAMNKMKQRLALLQTSKKDRFMSMEVLNCVGRTDGRRSSWKTGDLQQRRESAMLSSLLSKHEARQQSLHIQNLKLRQLLTLLNHEIRATMTTAELPAKSEVETTQLVVMELEDIEKLESDTKHQWQLLKSHIEELGLKGIKGMTSEPEVVACLKSELSECQQLLYLHEKVFKQFTSPPDLETKALLQDSYLLEERECFLAEQQRFAQERSAFKMERQRFTDAAICLGHERRLFEAERASWMQQQLSSLTPFRDLQLPSASSTNGSSAPAF